MARVAVSFRSLPGGGAREGVLTVLNALAPLRSQDSGWRQGCSPTAAHRRGWAFWDRPSQAQPSSTSWHNFRLDQGRVVDAQPGKLNLPGVMGDGYMLHHPIVQGTVVFKLQGAQAVGDAFQCVLNGMGKVVHGVIPPPVPLAVMLHGGCPVRHRVPHVEIAGEWSILAEGVPVVREFPDPHPAEQVQRLFCRPVPVGETAGWVGRSPRPPRNCSQSQLADVSPGPW